MNWLNLPVAILRDPNYVGSNPTQRATWLNLLIFSVELENNGRISGAKLWKSRQWQQTCGVTSREVHGANKLVSFDGDDVIVYGYPTDKELEVKAKREAGRLGGLVKSEAKTQAARANGTQANTQAEPKQDPSNDPTEGKGKEGKGKERNTEDTPAPPSRVFVPPLPAQVEEYSASIGYPLDGQAWCDSYAQKGWKVGKNTMKDWKAAVRNWKSQGWKPNASGAPAPGQRRMNFA